MSHTLNVVAVSGSLHAPSKTTSLVRAILDALERELSIDAHLIELSVVGREFSAALRRDELSGAAEADLRRPPRAATRAREPLGGLGGPGPVMPAE